MAANLAMSTRSLRAGLLRCKVHPLMNLIFRLLCLLLTTRWRGRLGPLDESVLKLRVWPVDLDVNLHMNNGRYLSVMDLGRVDVILRTGLLLPLLRRRWAPLAGSATLRFRRSLGPFSRYELRSRILGWDDKWFFFDQRFVRDGQLMAHGLAKALLRSRSGNVAPIDVLGAAGLPTESPPLSAAIIAWREAETAIIDASHCTT